MPTRACKPVDRRSAKFVAKERVGADEGEYVGLALGDRQ